MNNIIWWVGAIVIVLAILGYLGFRGEATPICASDDGTEYRKEPANASSVLQTPHRSITKMPGGFDQGFVDIDAIALKAASTGSILADPDACLVMMIALPLGFIAIATANAAAPSVCHIGPH